MPPALAALLLAGALLAGCTGATPAVSPAGHATTSRTVPCNLWNAIGDTPTEAELDAVPGRYDVVILNPWETGALARLREVAPDVTVLVYKDLSSTRSYTDDAVLPTGVGYADADRDHPEWFALDTAGRRIEWETYPGHWQMAVWDPAYRAEWTANVVAETVEQGWDGVFADNDFARLGFYSDAVLAGSPNQSEADQVVREGLDALVAEAGTALVEQGKVLVPNVSEARLFPGRWEEHTRFGGGMEEHFGYFDSDGGGEFLTDADPTGWLAQTAQVGFADRLSLTITRAVPGDDRAQRYGYLSAAVRGEGRTCWQVSTTGRYSTPEWTPAQGVPLGAPRGPGERQDSGVWTREFDGGWVAVNPTTEAATVTPPDGIPGGPVELAATDSVVRGRA